VIGKSDINVEKVERIQFDTDDNLWKLLEELKKVLDISPDVEYRIRNVKTDKLFCLEEMDQPLRSFKGNSDFMEGGKVVCLECGRPITMAEISITVFIHGKDKNPDDEEYK